MNTPAYLMSVLLVVFAHASFAQQYYQKAPIKAHLENVNQNWKGHPLPVTAVAFNSDNERIQTHLNYVIDVLEVSEKDYSDTQLQHRTALIGALRDYAQQGIFPVNTFHQERTPYFVDVYNTPCAVANLMLHSGNEELVSELQRGFNYNYIKDMPQKPLLAWAEIHGFEAWELSLIQPGYGSSMPKTRFLPGGRYSKGEVNLVVFDEINSRLCYAGKIDTLGMDVFGCISNEGFPILFEDVKPSSEPSGGVNDMVIRENGDYVLAGQFYEDYGVLLMSGLNVDQFLEPTKHMVSHSLELVGELLYFDILDVSIAGSPTILMSADLSQAPIFYDTIATIYGRIDDFLYHQSVLHIAGALDSANQDSMIICSNYLALKSGTLSKGGVEFFGESHALEVLANEIYLAGNCEVDSIDTNTCLLRMSKSDTTIHNPNATEGGDWPYFFQFQDILELYNSGSTILVGGEISSDFGRGIFDFSDGTFSGLAGINGTVNSIVVDQNDALVVGGDFLNYSYSNNSVLDNLERTSTVSYIATKVDTLVGLNEIAKNSIKIFPNPTTDYFTAEIDGGIAHAELFDVEGRERAVSMTIKGSKLTSSMANLPKGIYFLEITSDISERYIQEIVVN